MKIGTGIRRYGGTHAPLYNDWYDPAPPPESQTRQCPKCAEWLLMKRQVWMEVTDEGTFVVHAHQPQLLRQVEEDPAED